MAINSTQKFTKEELDELSNLQTEVNKLTAQFGSLHIAKIKLEKEESLLENQLVILEKKEKEIAKTLTEKYGKGSLNTETGEFTPVK
jgi:hypothetical protein|tara:strand:- start:288 stop:548 length:261 start_codon:yes stop_codon:yes gene_type:complete